MSDVGELWAQMHGQARSQAGELVRSAVPTDPGVYTFYRDGQAMYVGKASTLRRRISNHLGTKPDMSRSAFRRNVAEHLGFASSVATKAARGPGASALTAEQLTTANAWIAACEVAWVTCASREAAERLETDLKAEWMPPLTKR